MNSDLHFNLISPLMSGDSYGLNFASVTMSKHSFGQIREEITERYDDGRKKMVITYSGLGNAEKIVKISL